MDSRTLVERYALPPDEIETLSLCRVDAATGGLDEWGERERGIVRRLIYASGDPSIAERVRIHPAAIDAGLAALRRGCALAVDVRMVEVALDRSSLAKLGCEAHCAIGVPEVAVVAKQARLPRAVIAMRALATQLDGGIAVIGTAPTALLAVLDMVDQGAVRPALVVGTPVGFVAAAESKAELMDRDLPFITIEGTRGGAALAATTVNALLSLALAESGASEH
jgi:precorrin-8X/cobalt-precorrin-8 methylmutase